MNKNLILIATLAVISVGIAVWMIPYGAGEYLDSPDGYYTASAMNKIRGTIWGRVRYIELTIIEKKNQTPVWLLQHPIRVDEKIADYSDRSQKFIQWSRDSSSVRFTLHESKRIKVPVR